jgi:hypothetical protein
LSGAEQLGLQRHRLGVVVADGLVDLRDQLAQGDAGGAQVEPAEVRMLAKERDLELGEPVQRRARRSGFVEHGAHAGHELRPAPPVDLHEQVVLVGEEAVDAADRELGCARDLLHGGVVEALAREHVLGRVEDLLAAQFLVAPAPELARTIGHAVARAASSPRFAPLVLLS